MADQPAVPITLEGSYALHQMFRIRRAAWRQLTEEKREQIASEAVKTLDPMLRSALYSQIGHKGDVMLLHFRETLEGVHQAELALARLELNDYLEPSHSYLSRVELGLYESTVKTYAELNERGFEPHSAEWVAGLAEVVARQQAAMAPRLFPEIPASKYLCFYPMDRKRDEDKNWYTLPIGDRQRMMHEHGLIGRRYAGCVRQIITGSIGFDDWEWGVDLFADDPAVFKKLIYEMRFDEVSAIYALFGSFYLGLRVMPGNIAKLMSAQPFD
jgi:hydrogen peroxide-dependent heme synthase